MLRWTMIVAGAMLLGGCAPAAVQSVNGTVPVAGTVTLDGQPLKDGRISFIESEGRPRREYLAPIRDGKFETEAPPGPRRVEIRAFGKEIRPDVFEQLVPARYNNASELSYEVKPDAPNVVVFDLTTRKTESPPVRATP